MKKILVIFGTRPEAIKMAPLIKELQKHPRYFGVKTCVTGQHREMLDQVLEFFCIKPDYDLNIMKPAQTLFAVTSDILSSIEPIIDEVKPDVILVQGDTTSALVGALAGYYKQIDVGHLEAGLRSGDRYSPFPEEMNRVLVGRIAKYHFAPTKRAVDALAREGIRENVLVVGNTVVDALLLGLEIVRNEGGRRFKNAFSSINLKKRVVLITGHRRESFGEGFNRMCAAIRDLALNNADVEFVYPVHLNPNVQLPVRKVLDDISNIHLIEPLSYPELIWIMNKSYLVLTDSGGIQEEAPSLGKPVLVMRNVTERQEGIDAGTAKLTGTNEKKIISEVQNLLDNKQAYDAMANAVNPYGDGTASQQISEVLCK